jgi:hypothetical protein
MGPEPDKLSQRGKVIMNFWQEMTTDLRRCPTWQRVGLIGCMSGAIACLSVGLLGIVMIGYWQHVTNDWLDDHIFFWMEVGMPTTIGTFVFTRLMGIFH